MARCFCNALQHTATHCNTLQHTATHCNTLQHTATHYNTLQHTATHCNMLPGEHGVMSEMSLCTRTHVYVHTYVYMYTHICIHIHMSTHVCTHMNMHTCADCSWCVHTHFLSDFGHLHVAVAAHEYVHTLVQPQPHADGKRALQKRPIFSKEQYNFKEPTNRSHPIHV